MQAESYRFAGSIVPDNECQGLVKFNDVSIFRAEAPNALDEHLQCAVIYLTLDSVWELSQGLHAQLKKVGLIALDKALR